MQETSNGFPATKNIWKHYLLIQYIIKLFIHITPKSIKCPSVDFSEYPYSCPSGVTLVSWNHFPNEPPTTKSLSQVLLLGKHRQRQRLWEATVE